MNAEYAVTDLHSRLIDGWNAADADAMASALADDALVVGFDDSQLVGRECRILADHETAAYVTNPAGSGRWAPSAPNAADSPDE